MVELNLEGEVTVIKMVESHSKNADKHSKHIKINRENGCKIDIEVEPGEAKGLSPGDYVLVKVLTTQQTLPEE